MTSSSREVSEIKAGRELDALVAEKVMGWKLVHWTWHDGTWTRNSAFPPDRLKECEAEYPYAEPGWVAADSVRDVRYLAPILKGRGFDLPHYSTSIASAWEVLGGMGVGGWRLSLAHEGGFSDQWTASFLRGEGSDDEEFTGDVLAHTAPLAICLAALASLKGVAEK